MLNRSVRAFCMYLSMAALCALACADTRIVGKSPASCPNAQYNTISAAIADAAPGDEIDICPALYPEQLIVSKPLTLNGIAVNGVDRALLQPASMTAAANLPSQAVVTVLNTRGVTISNLAIDASNNTVSGCDVPIAGVHFLNSTGALESNAISGAQLKDPKSCPNLFPGNGFGVLVEVDDGCGFCKLFPFQVSIEHNSIHGFNRDGILAVGSGVRVSVSDNAISGVGPALGVNQFGVFLANGAGGQVTSNLISQGNCGAIAPPDCFNLRSEGVVLRSAADGTLIDGNIISNVQAGVFLNGANAAQITNNIIKNVDILNGIHVQFLTNSVIQGNRISAALPLDNQVCGIGEVPGTSDSGNTIRNNIVNDAYCGVAYVSADAVQSGDYFNTLYATLNSDQYPAAPPPPTEPQ